MEGYATGSGMLSDPPDNPLPGMEGVSEDDTSEEQTSVWDKIFRNNAPKTHSAGDGFYGQRRKVSFDDVVGGLMERGMPEHIAKGFAMNMEDESGLDTGINEISPLVPGSRGGFGLYQTTGPRRRQHEAFAKSKGTSAADFDTTLDFLMWELENTESRARDEIYATETAGEAAAAIVNKFLRPAESHREKRASKYLGKTAKPASRPNRLWLEF